VGIEAEILAGNPEVDGLCLALSDWSGELRILEDKKRRPASAERREGKVKAGNQDLME
jgi:hypothetical protein